MEHQITRDPPAHPSMDYGALLREGLDLAQKASGAVWTDYNEHDPGVTILEQLCYALTDLGYRTDYPVVDLLTRDRGTPPHTLYTGDQILPGAPVTHTDYQKILYDRVKGLKNVWLEPISGAHAVQGLYRVRVDVYADYRSPVDRADGGSPQTHVGRVLDDVRRILSETRTLTEDVDRVELIQAFPLRVHGTLVVEPEPSPEAILAQALFDVSNYLVPAPTFRSVASRLASEPPDAIFDGPLLQHGTIDDASIQPLRSTIPVAEVQRLLEQVPGVQAVDNFRVEYVDPTTGASHALSSGEIPLHGGLPHLYRRPSDVSEALGDLTLKRDFQTTPEAQPVEIDPVRVQRKMDRLDRRLADQDVLARRAARQADYRTLPTGTDRAVGRYHSVQHHFPLAYGVGPAGVPNDPSLPPSPGAPPHDDPLDGLTVRRARAKQLKAYLLFFEQLLANHLAQLDHLPDLFGLDPTLDRTYFTQPLTSVPDVDPLLDPDYADALPDLVTSTDAFLDRRNRVLDHLLARFHEAFPEEELDRCDLRPAGDKDGFYERLIHAKIDYLKHVDTLTRRRGRGYDPDPFAVRIAYHDDGIEITLRAPVTGTEADFETREELVALRDERLQQLYWLPVDALDTGFSDRPEARTFEARVLRNGVVGVTLRSVRGERLAYGWVVITKGLDVRGGNGGDEDDAAASMPGVLQSGRGERSTSPADVAKKAVLRLLRRLQHDDALRASCVEMAPGADWPQTSGLERRVRRLLLMNPTPSWPLVPREEIRDLLHVFGGLSLPDLLTLGVDPAHYAVAPADAVASPPNASDANASDPDAPEYVLSLSSKALHGVDRRHGKLFLSGREAVNARIDRLVASFRDLTARMEGFYLVEHVLLRPHAPFATSTQTFPTLDAARAQVDRIVAQLRDASDEVDLHKRSVPSYAGDPFELFLETPDADTVGTFYTPTDPESDANASGAGTRRPLPDDARATAYRVHVIDDPEAMCLRSFHLRSEAEASRWIQALLDHGRTPTSYVYTFAVDGSVSFDLYAPHRLDADDVDFYSYRVSAVFPSWPVRFQTPDFRELAHRLVRENAPAHVCVDVFWLDPETMMTFEKHYLAWLYARADPSTDPSDLDHHAALLRRTLESLPDAPGPHSAPHSRPPA